MTNSLACAVIATSLAAGPVISPVAGTRQDDRSGGSLQAAAQALARLDARDLSGRRWTAEHLRGRVVLLDFWATWCAPCLTDLPRLKALRARHSRADFEILGVSLDSTSRRTLVAWLNRQRADWPQIHEPGAYEAPTARLFDVDRLPMTILVRDDGTVDSLGLRGEALEARIHVLVAERHR